MPEIAEPATAARETILVVDDNVLVRMVIAAYLRDCGFRVIEAVDANEAIAVLEQPTADVDVVLSDVEMKGDLDGFGLNRWVRENRPAIAVILAGTPARASEAAADLCKEGPELKKPYDPQAVLDRIRRLLAARARVPGNPLGSAPRTANVIALRP